MAKKAFDEIWGSTHQTEEAALREIEKTSPFYYVKPKKTFDEIWGDTHQTEEAALREIEKTSPFSYAKSSNSSGEVGGKDNPTVLLQETETIPKKDFGIGYIGEQVWKGAVEHIGGLVNAGANLVDNPGELVDYAADILSRSNGTARYINNMVELADAATGGNLDKLKTAVDSNQVIDNVATAGRDAANNMREYAQESAYDVDNMNGLQKFAGDVARAVGGMAPTIVTGAVAGPSAGMAVMGTSVFGNSMQQALNEGASYDDALTYGIASAGVEYATEKLFGGIPYLGKGKAGSAIKKWVQAKLSSNTGKVVMKYIIDSVGEGAEELISEFAGEFLTDIYSDAKTDQDVLTRLKNVGDDAFYSFLLGAVTGGVMGAPGLVNDIRTGKKTEANAQEPQNQPVSEALNQEQTNTQPVLETQPKQAEINQKPKTADEMIKESINADAARQVQEFNAKQESVPTIQNEKLAEGLKSTDPIIKQQSDQLNAQRIKSDAKRAGISKQEQISMITEISNKLGIPLTISKSLIDGKAAGKKNPDGSIEIYADADMPTQIYVHELTHLAESSGVYEQLRESLFEIAKADGVDLSAFREIVIRGYAQKGVSLNDARALNEVTAYVAQKYLFKEDGIKRLVNFDMSLGQKIMEMIRNLRIRLTGTKAEKQLLKTEQLYKKAISEATNRTNHNVKYNLAFDEFTVDLNYPIQIDNVGDSSPYLNRKKIDRSTVYESALENIKELFGNEDGVATIQSNGRKVKVTKAQIKHGLLKNSKIAKETSFVSSKIGNVIKNAYKINEFLPDDSHAENQDIYLSVVSDSEGNIFPVRLIVDRNTSMLDDYGIIDKLYAAKAYKKETAGLQPLASGNSSLTSTVSSNITLRQLSDIVKERFGDTLPNVILEDLNYERPQTDLSDKVKYAISEKSLLETEQFDRNDRSFVSETLTQEKIDSLKAFFEKNPPRSILHRSAIHRQIAAFESGYETVKEFNIAEGKKEKEASKKYHEERLNAEEKKKQARENNLKKRVEMASGEVHIKKAKEIFGTTQNFKKAGFINSDGTMLDLSGGQRIRTEDHRIISDAFDENELITEDGDEMTSSAVLSQYLSEGNIRLHPGQNGSPSGIDLVVMPTEAQIETIKGILRDSYGEGFYVDFSDTKGNVVESKEYSRTSLKVIDDIRKYFSNKSSTDSKDIRYSIESSLLEQSKDPVVRARAQMEKRIRSTFLFNSKSNPLKMYDITARLEHEFKETGKISQELRSELFDAAYNETLRTADVPYKDLPDFKQMLRDDLNKAVSNYENTLIKERELLKFAQENDIPVTEVKLNPTTDFLKKVKIEDLPDKIISYKKLKANLKSDLIGEVENYEGGKQIDALIDQAAKEILEDGFISSTTKFKVFKEMTDNGFSLDTSMLDSHPELYDDLKKMKFNVPLALSRNLPNYQDIKSVLKTSTKEGVSIDQAYQELQSQYGEMFPDDITHPADQLEQIANVMMELEPLKTMLKENPNFNAEMKQCLKDAFADKMEDFKNQVLYRSQKDYYDRAARKQVAEDNAYNQITKGIADKFFQQNDEVKELMESEETIKGASIEDLAMIVGRIKDKGALSKTLAQNLDAMAGGDVVLRAKLSEIFEKPLREAKKSYVTNQKRVLNDVYKRIVQDLGIKMGSKESAAMMWYGEGRRALNNVKGKKKSIKLEYEPYTLDNLKKDFPKSWQNIVEADRIMREYYDDYIDRINGALERIYSERSLRETIAEKRTQLMKEIREGQENLERYKLQRTGEVGTPDVEAKISAQREINNQLIRQFNTVADDVRRNKRLKKRSDYYHHFQDIGMVESIRNILNGDSANNISNALAGISENTKPKAKWEGFMQKRSEVSRYEEDAIKGFLKYAPAAEYKIAFDPYVAQMRGTIQDMIKLSGETNVNNAKVINWLTNYTNSLAGKTNPVDRWVAHTEVGRTILRWLNKVNSKVKANAVVGNLNSAVSQFYNLPNGVAALTANGGVKAQIDIAKGSKDYAAYSAKKLARQDVSDSPINQSVFLAERFIDSTIEQFDQRIMHKPAKAATFLLTFGDQVVAEQLWFSAYNQAQRLGKNDAVAYADDLVARAVGGRGIGEVPLTQQSQLVKLIAPFQVEVNNAWQLIKQLGGGALKDKDKALGLLLMYAMTWVMNEINQALTGNRVGMDIFNAIGDVVQNWDEEKNPVTNTFSAAGRLGGEIVSNVPMGAQQAQMIFSDEYNREKFFGEADPSRFGTGNIGINAVVDPLVQLATGQNVDWQSVITNFVTPYGGKQLNRIYKMAEDVGIIPRIDFNTEDLLQVSQKPGAYNDKGQLKYQIDTSDPMNLLKGFVFGTYATNEGKEYIDQKYSALSEKKTAMYEAGVEAGANPNDLYTAFRNANVSRNITDQDGNTIDNSKAALNRQAFEDAGVFDIVEEMISRGVASPADFGLNNTVFEWNAVEYQRFIKTLEKYRK